MLKTIQSKFPDVYESYSMQASLSDAKYQEKMKFWDTNGINCFEKWTVPYFIEREKEKKRPCLRLNYPPDGKCNDCSKGTCRYDKVCFMCGMEGHGAFQSYPGGKLKGELKCVKHRNILSQLATIKSQHAMDEEDIRALFHISVDNGSHKKQPGIAAASTATSDAAHTTPTTTPTTTSAVTSDGTSPGPLFNQKKKQPLPHTAVPTSANNVQSTVSNSSLNASTEQSSVPIEAALMNTALNVDESLNSKTTSLGINQANSLQKSYSASILSDQQAINFPMHARIGSEEHINDLGANLYMNSSGVWGNSEKLSALSVNDNTNFPSLVGDGNMSDSGHLNQINNDQSNNSLHTTGLSIAHDGLNVHSIELSDSDDYGSVKICHFHLSKANVKYESNNAHLTFKGHLTGGCRINKDVVLIRAWKSILLGIDDSAAINSEIKTLRILSNKSIHIAKMLHKKAVDFRATGVEGIEALGNNGVLMGSEVGNAIDLKCIVSEYSEYGSLDGFVHNYMRSSPEGFDSGELKLMTSQLLEALMLCHEMKITHRDIRPSNILVCRAPDGYYSKQFGRLGLILKLANFTPQSFSKHKSIEPDLLLWYAPEIITEVGKQYSASSDLWSLGLVIYYLVTAGNLPFDSYHQSIDACSNANINTKALRINCLQRHGVQDKNPMLYDLLERLIRPQFMRTESSIIRCHPFLWTMECRKVMLSNFANASNINGSEVINKFVTGMEKISPLYVWAGSDGWPNVMPRALLNLVPMEVQSKYWSGVQLLQAINGHLSRPDILQQQVYRNATSIKQIELAYLNQIIEVNFPRLLILLYELGGLNGSWSWDGDDVIFHWSIGTLSPQPKF